MLEYCERYGWIEDPALLVRMLEKVAPVALPLLGRSITRSAFQDFFLPLGEGVRALIVNGPPGSGRTFMGDFLRLLVGPVKRLAPTLFRKASDATVNMLADHT